MSISLLIAYGLYSVESNTNRVMVAGGGLILCSVSLVSMIGINFDLPRTGVNVRTISGVFFALALLSSLFFSFVGLSVASYVVTNGIILLIFVLIVRTIYIAEQ